MRPLNQKSNVRLSWITVHDEYQPVKSLGRIGVSRTILYKWKDEIIGNSAYQTMCKQKWLTDISEFQFPAGKVWLPSVVECFDGKVVSWFLSTRPDVELVNTMLDNAVETLNAGERPVIHSD